MSELYRESTCRACQSELDTFLSLGMLYPSNFLKPTQAASQRTPFDLCACVQCRLVQLRHTVNPDTMFRQYWYKSGINETMKAELRDIVVEAMRRVPLEVGDVVMDVGANDGTLLRCYDQLTTSQPFRVAFEPAENLYESLRPDCEALVTDYFPHGLAQAMIAPGSVKILTSIACFYDLDDPGAFIDAVSTVLDRHGVWVVQFQDWDQMQKATAFDNICMEHLCYYSLQTFQHLITPFGLMVFDAETRAINGGSYRLYVGHQNGGWRPQTRAIDLLTAEADSGEWATFNRFAWRAQQAKGQIQSAVHALRENHVAIDLYGASTKANTLLQWCELDRTLVRQAWERSPDKFGLRTVGTNIPIIDEIVGRADPPGALLAGIWQFRDSILQRENAYLDAGGSIIFPLPKVDIVIAERPDHAA